MNTEIIIENAFYLLAMLNPASKVMFLASYQPKLTGNESFELSLKSSAAALAILTVVAGIGSFIFRNIFRVEIYSLQIAGGIILFFIGLNAVQEGRFLQKTMENSRRNFTDISIVPLAAPLIAGPGMIAVTISHSIQFGLLSSVLSLLIAVAINFLIMLFSVPINILLERTHILGPLIRLTGLIIAAISVQMVLSGIQNYIHSLA